MAAALAYNQARLELADGTVDWDTANLYMILVSSAYVFDATHLTYSDVSANEITDTDYSPQDIASATTALVATDDVLYDCEDVTFGASVTINADGGMAIILVGDELGPLAGDRLLFAWGLPASANSTNSEFTVTTGNGIYRINAA